MTRARKPRQPVLGRAALTGTFSGKASLLLRSRSGLSPACRLFPLDSNGLPIASCRTPISPSPLPASPVDTEVLSPGSGVPIPVAQPSAQPKGEPGVLRSAQLWHCPWFT